MATVIGMSAAVLLFIVVLAVGLGYSYRARTGCFKRKSRSTDSETSFYPYTSNGTTSLPTRPRPQVAPPPPSYERHAPPSINQQQMEVCTSLLFQSILSNFK